MPFTPFHMGPAVLLKSLAARRFSLLVFGVSQVASDIEPLVGILRGSPRLHGFTHTISGAVVVGGVAALVGRPLANWFLRILRSDVEERWAKELVGTDISWPVALLSAWIGTGSHLLLDGMMHGDMHPFAPLTAANPILGAMSLEALHVLCVATGAAGVAIMAATTAWSARRARSGPA
jgi:hypothetical protein